MATAHKVVVALVIVLRAVTLAAAAAVTAVRAILKIVPRASLWKIMKAL
jgi:hypothetical protein